MEFNNFVFPKKGKGEAFSVAQELLGKIDSRFNYYFQDLIYNVQFSKKIKSNNNIFANFSGNLLLKPITTFIEKANNKDNNSKFDFIINPSSSTFSRHTEQKLLYNITKILLDKKFKVCIIYSNPLMVNFLNKKLASHENINNLSLINPQDKIRKRYRIIFNYLSQIIAKLDYQYLAHVLGEYNIYLRLSSKVLARKIYTMLSWLWFSNQIEFETAILRVEWEPYSFLIKQTAHSRGKKTIAFQHGVISHTLDIPVTVDRFLTFGEQSAQFLQTLNEDFAKITGQTNICTDFRACGSVIDDIKIVPNNFEKKTVLIIDQSVERSVTFNGLQSQIQALEGLIEKLLTEKSIKKVIIRPHPEATISDFWVHCKQNYPDKLELSHAKFQLEMDINRSSVAIGLFSGALGITAASGLPSYWLKTPNGYYTRDLSCFDKFTLFADDILEDIKQIMSSEKLYLERRNTMLKLSQLYYKDNKKVEFDENSWKLLFE